MVHGERHIDGYWYYFDPNNGAMQTGWQNFDWRWLYYDNNGRMVHGMREINGIWHYFNQDHGGLTHLGNWLGQR